MAGQIIISNIKTDSDNAFSILANTGAVLFSANLASGITTNIANTRITGTITAGQLATSLNLATNNVQVASIQSATGTPGITFAANGQMTLANTPLQLTGGQIQFPATQIASGDANCLDDYEEGTFTMTDASGAGLSLTTSFASYTKIGRQVTVRFAVSFPSTANASSLQVGGLPFVTGGYSSGVISYNESPSADRSFLFQNGVNYIQIRDPVNTRTNANYSTREFHGAGSYFV
jgi:hypothetical protein